MKDTFNCYKCKTQYGKSEKMIGKTIRSRKSKGCFDYTTKMYRLENIKYTTCVGNYTKPIDFLLEAFSQYEKGLLPFKGCLGEQPSKIIDVFSLIESRRQQAKD